MDSNNPIEKNSLEQGIVQTKQPKQKVSILINAIRYFLHNVVIIVSEKGFRLLVVLQNRIIFDKYYNSLKGARISFVKLFKVREQITEFPLFENNEWTNPYTPDEDWLRDLLNLANMDN